MTSTPSEQRRKPTVLRLDDAAVTLAPLAPIEDAPVHPLPPRKHGSIWGKLFFGALAGLVSLSLGLSATRLIDELFARSIALGWFGLGLLALVVVAAVVVIGREIIGLRRLGRVETLQDQVEAAHASGDEPSARDCAHQLLALYASRPDLARARASLHGHLAEVVDGPDLLRLAERDLLADLDAKATRMVMDSARRISLVTAISPRALFDITIVLIESVRLIRRVAEHYGARPGFLGMAKLSKQVVGHLAITGGMAMGESLVQQLVGQGLAARLSAKLGEGIVNGMMTARIGLSTVDLVRPMPFTALARPKLSDVAAELVRAAPQMPEPQAPRASGQSPA